VKIRLALLQLQSVNKRYGKKQALRDVTFSMDKGEFLSVIGPSGSGKTTLLRMIDGLESPDSGDILFKGASIPADPQKSRKSVGMTFQNPILFNAKVFDNVAYSLRFRGESNQSVVSRTDEILKLLYLFNLRDRNALTLSGGEAQRVALARALVYDPELLLLDEPTANLDPYNVSIIEEALKALNRENGTTIILVTHNVFQAKRIAGVTALLLEGELVEIEGSTSFFESPRDPRVGAFIRGEMIY
jgi:tungstate transport system ATP-binding protein